MLKKCTSPYKKIKTLNSVSVEKDSSLLIFDKKLLRNPDFNRFTKKFKAIYGVTGGEKLKDIKSFPSHVIKIHRLLEEGGISKPEVYIVGGGSVGDFSAFFSSIYKRGVPFVQVPSTFLAAIDSAHGAKNALNVQSAKNQVGTYYPANKVLLVESILGKLNEKLAQEAYSEIFKMALIESHRTWAKKILLKRNLSNYSQLILKNITSAVDAKNKIVQIDPFEKKGIRYKLNLGHSLGHVFEAALNIPHGIAVAWGIRFALDFSFQNKILNLSQYNKLLFVWQEQFQFVFKYKNKIKQCNDSIVKKLLLSDKKGSQAKINYVFIANNGVLVKKINNQEVINFWKKWKKSL